jgi:hypothetical protein
VCEQSYAEAQACNADCWSLLTCVADECPGLFGSDRTACVLENNCDVSEATSAIAIGSAVMQCASECVLAGEDLDGG